MRTVILDNGHGSDTAGKRSPVWENGTQLFEWEFNRDIVSRISKRLAALCIPYHVLVREESDISLSERCKRANEIYANDNSAYLISIHANAGGGVGFELFTSVGETASDKLATIIFDQVKAEFPEWRMRTDTSDGDTDKESQFYILKNTNCPAILTENGFMDTKSDCELLMDSSFRQRIAEAHIKAILNISRL